MVDKDISIQNNKKATVKAPSKKPKKKDSKTVAAGAVEALPVVEKTSNAPKVLHHDAKKTVEARVSLENSPQPSSNFNNSSSANDLKRKVRYHPQPTRYGNNNNNSNNNRPEQNGYSKPVNGFVKHNNNNNKYRRPGQSMDNDKFTSDKDLIFDRNSEGYDSVNRKSIDVQNLKNMAIKELEDYATSLGVENVAALHRQELVYKILESQADQNLDIFAEGVLEKLQEGFGFLRSSKSNYLSGPDDVYVSPIFVKKFVLKTGDFVRGVLRAPREGEKYFALKKIETINLKTPAEAQKRTVFENLTPIFPTSKFTLDSESSAISSRALDILCPIGKGQRGLIVAPPKTGKTVFLKELANSILTNNPNIHMIILLVDERPEEVTDMARSIKAEVVSSTFDESASRHVQVAEIVIEKARRMVECGYDVVIILDSITRLARAYNTVAPSSGKILSGGIDANALHRPKKFFGAARNVEEGGSLTIIASALVDTGSKMDEVIFEEFKGTGNMEVRLTRKLSDKRVYPAIDVHASGTRRDDLLVDEEILKNMWILQRLLSTMNTADAMEFLIEKITKTKDNKEFWELMNKRKA